MRQLTRACLLVGAMIAVGCGQVAHNVSVANDAPTRSIEWGGFSIRYRADVAETLSEPVRYATVFTQQSGTYPSVQVISHATREGEWTVKTMIPNLPPDKETSANLFVYLPCQPYEEVAFRNAARYVRDPVDRNILKAQYRFNMRPGNFLMEIKAAGNECEVVLYKVGEHSDRSTWQRIAARPVEFEKYFLCEVSAPQC